MHSLFQKEHTAGDWSVWQRKKVHSGQYLCCSHSTTSLLLTGITKMLCVAGCRVPLDD